jgi:hypothetical protein
MVPGGQYAAEEVMYWYMKGLRKGQQCVMPHPGMENLVLRHHS